MVLYPCMPQPAGFCFAGASQLFAGRAVIAPTRYDARRADRAEQMQASQGRCLDNSDSDGWWVIWDVGFDVWCFAYKLSKSLQLRSKTNVRSCSLFYFCIVRMVCGDEEKSLSSQTIAPLFTVLPFHTNPHKIPSKRSGQKLKVKTRRYDGSNRRLSK